MNEVSRNQPPIQPETQEQVSATPARELFNRVHKLAELRAQLEADIIDSGNFSAEKLEELDDVDHRLLGARADLFAEEGTAGAKPEDE